MPVLDNSQATVSSTEIGKDFVNNKIAAENKYKQKGTFFIKGDFVGFVDSFDNSFNQITLVELEGADSLMQTVKVKGLTKSFMATLSKGKEVTMKVKFGETDMLGLPIFNAVK